MADVGHPRFTGCSHVDFLMRMNLFATSFAVDEGRKLPTHFSHLVH
jgi:hypothetical protein